MPERFLARLARGAGYVLTGNAPADWFGPQQPLSPQAPPDVAGRQFDYPFGFNLAFTPRSWEPTGFAELRALADSYDLLRTVIETRKDQMERLTWRIRPRGIATGSAQTSLNDPRLAALTAFFHCPDKQHGWASWLRMLLEDLLVIDAPTLYKRRNRGGGLWALELLDGATIKRLIDDWGRTPAPPTPAYQQILKGLPAVDYTADDLIYAPRNPRVHKAYGYSPVEQVQMSVNIALRRQIYQLQYYTEGNVPEALIGVPESWNPDQIRQFQTYWDSINAGDTAERRHAKFVPGGVAKTFVPVREPAMKDMFDEWLARVVCFAFSVPPSAFTGQVNRATADTAQDVSLSEGMAPLQLWVKHLIDRVIAEEFAAPDLEFAWDQDRDADPAQTATIAVDYVKAGIKSVNEVRAELGLPPVKGGEQPTPPPAQGGTGGAPAEKLLRFNPNHYGPGQNGGQFAPSGEGGAAGDADGDSGDEDPHDAASDDSTGDAARPVQVADSGQNASDANPQQVNENPDGTTAATSNQDKQAQLDQIAAEQLSQLLPKSQEQQKEIVGVIYQTSSGGYQVGSTTVSGKNFGQDVYDDLYSTVRDASDFEGISAVYLTQFSGFGRDGLTLNPGEVVFAHQLGVQLYVALPNGRIANYDGGQGYRNSGHVQRTN